MNYFHLFFFVLLLLGRVSITPAQSYQPEKQPGNLPNILQAFTDTDNLRNQALLVVNHNESQRYTAVHAVLVNNNSSRQSRFVFIDSVQLGRWQDSPQKAKVRQTYENAVLSGEKKPNGIPLEFQYQFQAAANNHHFLVYRYDYSQPDLTIHAFVLDSTLKVVHRAILIADEGSTVHGLYLDDQIKIIMLISYQDTDLNLLIYDPHTTQSDLLTIEAGNLRRRSFAFFSSGNGTCHTANLCETEPGHPEGIMVSSFDLEKKKVLKVLYHPFTEEFAKQLDAQPPGGITDVMKLEVNERGEASVLLEKHSILSTAYRYNPYQANDILLWKPRLQKTETEARFNIEFFLGGRLVREEILK